MYRPMSQDDKPLTAIAKMVASRYSGTFCRKQVKPVAHSEIKLK